MISSCLSVFQCGILVAHSVSGMSHPRCPSAAFPICRSHVVFSITLESTSTFEDGTNVSRRGELKIVDLAGNEKAGRASEGVENAKLVLEEGKAINKSLFLLSYATQALTHLH